MNNRNDTKVKCSKCGKEKQVNFKECLGSGWPKCCGYTMRMINTKANIEQAVSESIRNDPIIQLLSKVIGEQDE